MSSLTGQFLIASKELVDPNFHQSVVLLVQHSVQGAMGVIVNRPTPTTVAEAWEKITGEGCEVGGVVHLGGPCEGTVSVLHTDGDVSDIAVSDHLFFSANKDSIEQIVASPPDECRFFIGYAGWGPGQLEVEIGRGDWRLLPADLDFAFGQQEELWETLGRKSGGLSVLAALDIRHLPSDPTVN